jgi:hypothetical protein
MVNIIDYTVQLYIMHISAKGEFAITATLIVRLAKRACVEVYRACSDGKAAVSNDGGQLDVAPHLVMATENAMQDESDFRDQRKIVTHSFDKSWLGFLEASELCIPNEKSS